MKRLLFLGLVLFLTKTSHSQITLIPDQNFEQELINQGIDSDNTVNGQVFTADIATVSNLNVPNRNISDFTGLEDFSFLFVLDVSGNPHSSLDLTPFSTTLQSVNSSNSPNLSSVSVGSNVNLLNLNFGNSALTSLNVALAPNLEFLNVFGTQITNIDVSNLGQLQTLTVGNTPITTLNVNGLTNLSTLDAGNMPSLSGNLDLSSNAALTTFLVSNSQLTSIDLRNNNNLNMSLMNASNNSSLTCIAVDDPNNIPINWQKDATTSYSASCIPSVQIFNFPATITSSGQATVDIIFSEPVNGFTQGDIVINNATVVNFIGAQGSSSYSAVIDWNQSVICNGLTITMTIPQGVATGVNTGGANSDTNESATGADLIPPTLVLRDITAQLNANGQVSITPEGFDDGSTDNCTPSNNLVFTLNQNTLFDCSDIGTNTITVTVTDALGNAASGNANLTIVDDLPPTATAQDFTVQLGANGQASIAATDVDGGSTDNCAVASVSINNGNFDCSNVGANTVTLTVTDVNGNTSTDTATVTVEDAILPIVITQNATVTLNANGQASITANDIDGGSNDNCGIASITAGPASFDCNNLGANTVTLTVTDVNGNTATNTATVNVNELPLTAIAQDITVQLDANGQATIAPQDVDNGSASGCSSSPALSLDVTSFDCTDIGPNTVILTATSGANTDTASATVTIVDSLPPTLIVQDATIQLNSNGGAILLPTDVVGSVTDNCQVTSTTLSKTSFDCSNAGQNEVVITTTDGNGNSTSLSATVTVEDAIFPNVITQNATVQLNANGEITITSATIDGGSNDNCGLASVVPDKTTFTCSDLGTNTVTLIVTDVNGNVATDTAILTVEDNQPLTAIARDITVQLDANGQATIAPQDVDNGSGSGCGNVNLTLDVTNFDCNDIGQNTVILTVTEGPNTETATAIVTVEDNLAPTVITQDITVQLDPSGNAMISAQDVNNGSSDNCLVASTSLDINTFSCSDIGANMVLLTVTDASGNSASGTATITVVDNTDPVAVTQDITVQLDASGNATINTSDINNGSSDNCSITNLSLDISSFTCSDIGQNTIVLTVTDSSGNTNTAPAVVTVQEDPNQPLMARSQDITVQLDANGQATIIPQDVDNGSGSGCSSGPTLSLDITSFNCDDIGTNTVTLTATENGISSSTTAIVTVEDNLAPNILTQDITIQLGTNNMTTISVVDIDDGTTDNCTATSGISLSLDTTMFNCSDLGTNTVTLTATDANGNMGTATATVTVLDVTPPTVITRDLTIALDSDGNASVSAEQIDNGSNDGCSGLDSLSLDVTEFSCPSLGNVTVTLMVTDTSGNSATGTATVTITAEDFDNNGIADACENQELVVSKGFSPNGDNRNDTWTIENIENYPNARVSVFNRWGEKVYEQLGYQNDWDAVSNQINTNRRLPAGSYLYIIETNDLEAPPIRGWMYINY